MYMFILWMCLANTTCPLYESIGNRVMIFKSPDRQTCEAQWKESLAIPDPQGFKSYHTCQPVETAL